MKCQPTGCENAYPKQVKQEKESRKKLNRKKVTGTPVNETEINSGDTGRPVQCKTNTLVHAEEGDKTNLLHERSNNKEREIFLGLFTGHDATRGSGQERFKASPIGSGRVGS